MLMRGRRKWGCCDDEWPRTARRHRLAFVVVRLHEVEAGTARKLRPVSESGRISGSAGSMLKADASSDRESIGVSSHVVSPQPGATTCYTLVGPIGRRGTSII